ncbi:methylamine dehydrogenase accessory protein MauD [Inquilinus limosus]|uniref:methylamine dehydrogenase accessory protein MauD n=1 Tax=Inquilinus limosus TaxID=171674 RepID=UPI003F159EA3
MDTTALTWAVILLAGVVVVLAVMLAGLARQIGLLHERIAPMGAMVNDRGPEVGEMAPDLRVTTLAGQEARIGGPSASGRMRLIFFVSPSCPICKKLLPIARSFVGSERLDVLLVGDGDPADQARMRAEHGIEHVPYVNSPQLGMAFRVGKLPYAVLIDEEGVIRAKGLVNSREHLESLVIAKESGYGTIQAYLKARGYVGEAAAEENTRH